MKTKWQVRVTPAVWKALRFRALELEKPASTLATEIIGKALGVPKDSPKHVPAKAAQG